MNLGGSAKHIPIIASIFLISLTLSFPDILHGEVSTDGSLGPQVSLEGPDFSISQDLGQTLGTNLFHSFETFSIQYGESATFSGAASIENIISRVTGGSESYVNGLLKSTIDGANLFLLNPGGIMFGPQAQLDIKGSFHASTADYLKFDDGSIFYTDLAAASVLSVAQPEAFGFLSGNPGSIAMEDSRLWGAYDGTLSLVGGDLSIIGEESVAEIWAGGKVQLVGVGRAGEVNLNSPEVLSDPDGEHGNITISNADVSAYGYPTYTAGTVVIRGGRIQLDNSSLYSINNSEVDSTGPALDIEATSLIEITDSSALYTNSGGAGNGSDIRFTSKNITMGGSSEIWSGTIGQGDGSSILINAEVLILEDESYIQTSSPGSGSAGSIQIDTGEDLMMETSSLIKSTAEDQGNGGNITINSKTLSLEGGASIQTSSSGSGPCGSIQIGSVDFISIDGSAPPANQTGIFSLANSTGTAGALSISTESLELRSGGIITSSSAGDGESGNLSINAAKIELINGSGIRVESVGAGKGANLIIESKKLAIEESSLINSIAWGIGDAGDIAIETESLAFSDGAAITASSLSNGSCGSIRIDAYDSILIDGGERPAKTTGISAYTAVSGAAGEINVSAKSLELMNGGTIGSSSAGDEDSGNAYINSDQVKLSGGSTLLSYSTGPGKGADILLKAENLSLESTSWIFSTAFAQGESGGISIGSKILSITDESVIFTSSDGSGACGSIQIQSDESILVDAGSSGEDTTMISSHTNGSAASGEITVSTDILNLLNGGAISSNSSGEGDSGAITVVANQINSDYGMINSNGGIGDSANVFIRSNSIEMVNDSVMSASTTASGNSGLVDINAENILIDGSSISNGTVSAGNGGNITIETSQLMVRNGALIEASTFGEGKGGNISIKADDLTVSGSIKDGITDITTMSKGTGDAGNMTIAVAKTLKLLDGGGISADANNSGNAGEIVISAPTLLLSGTDPLMPSTISSTLTPEATGLGGHIQLQNLNLLRLEGEASILAGTSGAASAGSIDIDAEEISLNHGIIEAFTSGAGNGGSINITAQNLTLQGGNGITCETQGSGSGGNLQITANNLLIDGADGTGTGLFADSTSTGPAGAIHLNAKYIGLHNGARISTETTGTGKGGDITLQSETLLVNTGSSISSKSDSNSEVLDLSHASGLDPAAAAAMGGGNITISANNINLLNDGQVTVESTAIGDAGNIDINAASTLYCENAEISSNAAQADGGNISIRAGEMIRLKNGQLTASVGGGAATIGGNIDLNSEDVTLADESQVIANAYAGQGGHININAAVYLAEPTSVVDASSALGIDGVVDIQAPFSNLSGSLKPLPKEFLSAVNLFKEPCEARVRGGDYGSFITKGRDALPIEPGALQMSPPLD